MNVSVLIPSRMPWQVSLTLDILQIAKQQRLELLLSTIFWYVELPKWRQIGGEMVLAFPVNKEILSPETTNTIVEDYVPMIQPKLDATKPKNCFTFVTLLLFCHNQWAWKQWDREVDIGLNFFQNEKKNYFQKVTFGLLVHWTFKETSEGEEESINKLNQMKGRDPVLKHKKKMNQKNSQNHEKFHIGCVCKSWHFSFLDLFSLPCNRGKNLMSMRCSTWSVAFFECLRKWNLLNSYFWV